MNAPVDSGKIRFDGLMGCISAITPIVNIESARTLPKIFPNPSSQFFVSHARIEKANSGRHVPTATTTPSRNKGKPREKLIVCASSVTRLLPMNKTVMPIIRSDTSMANRTIPLLRMSSSPLRPRLSSQKA